MAATSAADASRAATDTTDTTVDDREARFLASQSARLQQAASSGTGRSATSGNSDDGSNDDGQAVAAAAAVRTQFWDGFRRCCAVLSRELGDIGSGAILDCRCDEDNGGDDCDGAECSNSGDGGSAVCEFYATASARAVASSRLDAALASLRLLERHCLSTSSSASIHPTSLSSSSPTTVAGGSDAANNEEKGLTLQLPATVPDHLPPGDVRLLTTELGSLQNRLEDLREDICPPELFVFRRYRAAMAARRENAMNKTEEEGGEADNDAVSSVATDMNGLAVSTNSPSGSKIDEKNKEEEHLEQHYGSSIRNQNNCIIEITDSEILSYTCSSEEDTATSNANVSANAATTSTPLGAADVGSSLLIKDVERCKISINRQYQSIHIINATDCTIAAHFAISGPVHVTNCHGTTISAACRQLRIHDCTAVTFRVWVKSGPIIEHCSEMVFRCDPIDVRGVGGGGDGTGAGDNGGVCHWDEAANMYHDVKDFCWLRTGVPSPNFTVVQCSDSGPGGTEEEGADEDCADHGQGQEVTANDDANTKDDDGDASSSDEDEL